MDIPIYVCDLGITNGARGGFIQHSALTTFPKVCRGRLNGKSRSRKSAFKYEIGIFGRISCEHINTRVNREIPRFTNKQSNIVPNQALVYQQTRWQCILY